VDPAGTTPGDAPTAGQWQVSAGGGIYPTWRADGKELYYIAPDLKLMAAPVETTRTTPQFGTPVALFATQIFGDGEDTGQGRQYDVDREGRFLINVALDSTTSSPITLIQNWRPSPEEN
jgi:hypothetical protein